MDVSFYETELNRTVKNIVKLESDRPLLNLITDRVTYLNALSEALQVSNTGDSLVLGEILNNRLRTKKAVKGAHTIMSISNAKLVLDVADTSNHQLLVVTPNASYGYGSKRIVTNWHSLTDYMYNALSKIPKSLKTQKVQLMDFKKSIKANQKVLELRFEKSNELEMVQKRLVEINADLDEKYDAEPEEKEEQNTEKSKSAQKFQKPQGISL